MPQLQYTIYAISITFSAWTQTVPDLVSKLEIACENAIDWFKLNIIIVNLDKFQAILLSKINFALRNLQVNIDQTLKSASPKEVLAFLLDKELNFNLYISSNCTAAANQFNPLMRLK